MNYTVKKMFMLPAGTSLAAFADVTVNGVLTIRGVRVLRGRHGLLVTTPQEQGKDNKWFDQVVFDDAEEYARFSATVCSAFNQRSDQPAVMDTDKIRDNEEGLWTNAL